ncbi:ATP-binding protein [Ralstonia sp. R-29]|uniref:ATP-binding protein n=1 Tax=Ralstonia sp. R-29 TaxID=3404059 RepID=UPI003CF24F0C
MAQAQAGAGGIAALAGEPGIGKTRTAEIVAERAERRGMRALWGRCNEEPGAPPYWPWQQLVRSWIASHDEASIRQALAGGVAPLAEIVPDLADRLPDQALGPAVGPLRDRAVAAPSTEVAQARFRLFDAVNTFWQRAAQQRPLLLVLDNVHWADASSLRLLEFLAPDLCGSRILLLVTYRDVELSRQHPLSATLGELARQPRFERLRLGGLTHAETADMMQLAGGATFAPALVDAIHAQTEGNPLFVGEMTRLLAQESSSGGAGCALRIPEGIKEVIGRRLNRLSARANKVLTAAAVIGRAFEFRLLTALADDVDEDICSAAIDEALQARVVEALREPGHYHFAHALFRETLYDEIPVPRRSRLHLKLARAIEMIHGDDPEPHLPALAYHHWAALPGGDAALAVDYAQRAARRADRQLAHEESARYCQMALQAMDAGSGVSRDTREMHEMRCSLLNALGTAHSRAGDWLQAMQTFKEAARLSVEYGNTRELANAALGFETASWSPGLPGGPAAELLREALAAQGSGDPVMSARLLSALARALIFSGEEEQATRVHEQAIAVARRAGDPATLADTLVATVSLRWQHERIAERIAASDEAYELARQAGDPILMCATRAWHLFDDFELGDMAAWRANLEEYERGGETLRLPFVHYTASMSRAMHALFEGRFADAERLIPSAYEIARRMPGMDTAGVYGVQMFMLRREQGRLHEVAPLVEHFVQHTSAMDIWQPGIALMYVELGQLEAARKKFDALANNDFRRIARDGVWVANLTYLALVCHALGDAARAPTLYRLLAPFSGRNLVFGTAIASFGAADAILGALSTTMGDWPQAQQHFEAALAMNERQGARPALVRTRLAFAQMLLRRGVPADLARADALLHAAEAEAATLGMAGLPACIDTTRALAKATAVEHYPAGLSRREVQVLRLVALGKGNRQIARELFVSPNTVANHVSSILGKTHSANRAEAAAFAIRHALL